MPEVSVFDARNRLSALIEQVERGEEVTITRRGKVVARLVRAQARNQAAEAAEELLRLRQRIADRGESFSVEEVRAFREEGRR